MTNASLDQLKEQGVILGVAFAFYILLSIIAMIWVKYFPKLLPKKIRVNKNTFEQQNNIFNNPENGLVQNSETEKRALVMWMMLIFGSTTFFGLPIIKILMSNGENGVIAANIWNIPYRIFLYSFAFMVMAGLKFDKSNIKQSAKTALLNPIVIATFTGLILWLTQLIPGASNFGENFKKGENGWFNFNNTMPYIYTPINTVGGLSSPLVWLSIGITLASSSLLSAVKDKWVWIFSFQKLVLIPLLVFFIMLALVSSKIVTIDVAKSMVIFAAVPPATVVVAYAMQYKTSEKFATQCSALCTLGAIIFIPVWIIISTAVFQIV